MSFSTAAVLSYYPKYIYLDKVIADSGKKKIILYIDLKNCLRSLYIEPFVKNIINETNRSRHFDISVFTSFLEFVSFHKSWAKKRNIELEMVIFFDQGKSDYHKKISNEYKGSRDISDMFHMGEEYTQLFFKILTKNYDMINNVGNKIPGVTVIRLEYMETDFIPYYLINRVYKNPEDSVHLIYSNDKDFYQVLDKKNIYQFIKKPNKTKILSQQDVYIEYLGSPVHIDVSYMPLFHAINGDSGDDITGIKGIAQKTLLKISDDLPALVGSMDDVYKNIK